MLLNIIFIAYLSLTITAIILAYKWFREPYYAQYRQTVSWGITFSFKQFWIGINYTKYSGRTRINILPCITIWIGNKPTNI